MPPIQGSPSLSIFRTAARGMESQRLAVAASTENLANAQTTRTEDGEPYFVKRAVQEGPGPDRFGRMLHRHTLELRTTNAQHRTEPVGLRAGALRDRGPAAEIVGLDQERLEYDPSHPHADAFGYVRYADINVAEEMARLISAQRVYEANLTSVEAAKEMLKRTMEI